jgi:DNA-binding SARP family transcriptional activator
LGDPEVRLDGAPIPLPASKKTRALLACLALSETPKLRDSLCSLLWDGPDDPRAALRWSLSKLRAVVERDGVVRLVADRERVRFEGAGALVDVIEVRRAAARGVDALDTPTLEVLVALFRGPFLEGLELSACPSFHAWCAAEREDLRALHVAMLVALAGRTHAESGTALRHARALVALDPLAESSRVRLIRLLAELGQSAQALDEYQEFRRTLERELGVTPSLELEQLRYTLTQAPAAAVPAERARPALTGLGAPTRVRSFVGRESERQKFKALVEGAPGGFERLLLVLGEPGIGKSFLLEELQTLVAAGGGGVLTARAFEAEMVRPYGVFIDALRSRPFAGTTPDPFLGREEIATERRGSSEQQARERLYEAVSGVLEREAVRKPPLCLVLDDLQWFDTASLALLHYLVRTLRGKPVIIACSARAAELEDNPAARRLLRALASAKALDSLELEPLASDEVRALTRAIDPNVDAAQVFVESAGNPLFAVEVAQALAARHAEPSATLSALILDRLSRIEPKAQRLLPWAAALGRSFDVDVLARVTASTPLELVEILQELERHGVVRPAGASHYDFSHDLVRRAAYRQMSEPRRRLVHAQIARGLAALPDRDGTVAGDVAHHALLGNEPCLGARACVLAGQRCLRLFAYTEAKDLSQRGLGLIVDLPPEERLSLEVELLALRVPAPTRDAARQLEADFSRAIAQARAHALAAVESRGLFLRSVIQYHDGNSFGAEQSSQLRLGGRDPLKLPLTDEVVSAARCLALLERDMARVRAVLAMADSHAGPVDALDVVWTRGLLRHFDGELEPALALLMRALEVARERHGHWEQCDCLLSIGRLELELGRLDGATQAGLELLEVATKMGDPSKVAAAKAVSALAAYAREPEISSDSLHDALEGLRRVDDQTLLAVVLSYAAERDLTTGRFTVGRRHAVESLAAAELVGHASQRSIAHALLARLDVASGDVAAARDHLARVSEFSGPERISARAERAVAAAQRALAPDPTLTDGANEEYDLSAREWKH